MSMALITRTSSPSFTLVDDTTLRQWLRIDDAVDAETLTLQMAAATDYLEGQTGRVLAAASYTIALDAVEPCIALGLFPLNSVSSVVANLADGTSQTLTAGSDYRISITSQRPSLSILNVPAKAASFLVTCNAGYTSQDAVPASLQQAAAVLVAAGYDNRSALDPKTFDTVSALISRYRAVGI
jgi:uncharacterized phiE125 gp8 family phage protein